MIEDHMGKIIKEAIKKNGKTIKQIAYEMGISRNTLYNKFKLPYIRYEFIKKLEIILDTKFNNVKILKEDDLNINYSILEEFDEKNITKKYFKLLEKYNQLLIFLIRISNSQNTKCVKEEINVFLKKNLIYNTPNKT